MSTYAWGFALVFVFVVLPILLKVGYNYITKKIGNMEIPSVPPQALKQAALAEKVAKNKALLEAERSSQVRPRESHYPSEESSFTCICSFDEEDCDAHSADRCEYDCA